MFWKGHTRQIMPRAIQEYKLKYSTCVSLAINLKMPKPIEYSKIGNIAARIERSSNLRQIVFTIYFNIFNMKKIFEIIFYLFKKVFRGQNPKTPKPQNPKTPKPLFDCNLIFLK